MAYWGTIVFLLLILEGIIAPPVTKEKPTEEDSELGGLEDYMEYHRYLKEVVNALESDPEFRKKLEVANESDIRSGKIAEELEFVSHHVRTRLDEIKRVELTRLKELTEKKRQLMQNENLDDPNHHGHLDHANPHTFEIDDLKKLIAKTTQDLAEADRRRKEEFKQYELQKEYEKQRKLNNTNGSEREKLEREIKEREEQHKKHDKLHEPGHKAQLEEVWEQQDQMQQDFDPKTFFMLHDVDSNGLWDQDEVKALFVKELEKMYQAGHPEDDMRERAEELERMREAVYKEVDLNRDGFIDFEEFLAQTKRNDFQQDHGWQGLDEKKPYTDEELEEYVRQHEMMLRQQGYYASPHNYPPNMQYQVPPGGQVPMHPNAVPQGQYHPGQPVPPQAQFHPGQINQQHPQQLQGQLPDLNTNEIYQNQQYHPNQAAYQHPNVQYKQASMQQQNQANLQQQQNYPNMQQQNNPNIQQQNQPNIQSQQPNIQQNQINNPNSQPNVQYNINSQPNVPQQQPHNPNLQAGATNQNSNVPQQQVNSPPQQGFNQNQESVQVNQV